MPTAHKKPPSSRAEQVHEQILSAIRSGIYPPGTAIRETEVAQRFEVSRTPVRDAFRRLEADGIVTFESHRGVIVARLDRQQISELYAMRGILEGAAARLAARHIDEAEIEMLDMLLAKAEQKHKAGADANEQALINRQFHDTIYAAAHNRYLLKTLAQIGNVQTLLIGTTYTVPDRATSAAQEHQALTDAIRQRDPEKAEAAARAHITAAHRARLSIMLTEETDHA